MPSQIAVPNVIAVDPVLAGDEWRPSDENLVALANVDQLNLCKRPGLVLIPDGLKEPNSGRVRLWSPVAEYRDEISVPQDLAERRPFGRNERVGRIVLVRDGI